MHKNRFIVILSCLALLSAIFVQVKPQEAGAASDPQIAVTDFSISPGSIKPGDIFSATITLQNTGDSSANPVTSLKLSVNENAPNSLFAPYLSGSTVPVKLVQGTLVSGEQISKTIKLGSSSSAAAGINNLYITIRYRDSQGKDYSSTEVIGIPVEKNTAQAKDTPKLMVSQVRLAPEAVEVGGQFSMFLKIKNSGGQDAKSVKVTAKQLEGSSGLDVFSPAGASNAFTIDRLQHGTETEKAIELSVSPKAKPKTYNMVIDIDYRDEDGISHNTSEVVSVPAYKGGKAYVTEVGPKLLIQGQSTSKAPVRAGDDFELTLGFTNATSQIAKNIRIEIQLQKKAMRRWWCL